MSDQSRTWDFRYYNPNYWGDDPGPRHDLRCPVNTDPGPVGDPEADCTCPAVDGHTRPTTAERLDALDVTSERQEEAS